MKVETADCALKSEAAVSDNKEPGQIISDRRPSMPMLSKRSQSFPRSSQKGKVEGHPRAKYNLYIGFLNCSEFRHTKPVDIVN